MNDGTDGILILDKPEGLSSAKALEQVKRTTGAKKAGHAGTLDPFATGVLVCCLGSATRLAHFFLKGTKRYEGLLRLGEETDTQDHTGKRIRSSPVPDVGEKEIAVVFRHFTGDIQQLPPVYSALKHNGQPLYRLARAGRPVQKSSRTVRVHALKILAIELPDIRFDVLCTSGTYIRTLCADIGHQLGCGGHLRWLRRTESSGFAIDEAVDFQALTCGRVGAEALIDPADALRTMPPLRSDPETSARIGSGQPVSLADFGVPSPGGGDGLFKVIAPNNRLLAVVKKTAQHRRLEYCCVFPDAWTLS